MHAMLPPLPTTQGWLRTNDETKTTMRLSVPELTATLAVPLLPTLLAVCSKQFDEGTQLCVFAVFAKAVAIAANAAVPDKLMLIVSAPELVSHKYQTSVLMFVPFVVVCSRVKLLEPIPTF